MEGGGASVLEKRSSRVGSAAVRRVLALRAPSAAGALAGASSPPASPPPSSAASARIGQGSPPPPPPAPTSTVTAATSATAVASSPPPRRLPLPPRVRSPLPPRVLRLRGSRLSVTGGSLGGTTTTTGAAGSSSRLLVTLFALGLAAAAAALAAALGRSGRSVYYGLRGDGGGSGGAAIGDIHRTVAGNAITPTATPLPRCLTSALDADDAADDFGAAAVAGGIDRSRLRAATTLPRRWRLGSGGIAAALSNSAAAAPRSCPVAPAAAAAPFRGRVRRPAGGPGVAGTVRTGRAAGSRPPWYAPPLPPPPPSPPPAATAQRLDGRIDGFKPRCSLL